MRSIINLIHKIIPRQIKTAAITGAILGLIITFIILGTFGSPDAGMLLLPLVIMFTFTGAFVMVMFNRLVYGGKAGKQLFFLGLVLLVVTSFLPTLITEIAVRLLGN